MRHRLRGGVARIDGGEDLLGLVELTLLDVGAGEDELRRPDLLDVIESPLEKLERACGDDFGLVEIALRAVDLGERAQHVAGLGLEVRVDEDRERVSELRDRDVVLSKLVVDPGDVVEHAAHRHRVADLGVEIPGRLGVPSREHPAPEPIGDEGGLQMYLRARSDVVDRVAELQGTIDVLARRLEVTLPPVAARTPLVDVEPETIVGLARLVEELECPVELGHGRRDLGEGVAAHGGEVRDLRLLLTVPGGAVCGAPCLAEQVSRLPDPAEADQRPRLAADHTSLREAWCPRLERAAQITEHVQRLGIPMLIEMVLAEREPLGDPLEIGCAQSCLEDDGLDAEPRGQPVQELPGRNDLSTLDLTHVLLREPTGCQSILSKARGLAERADTTPEVGRRRNRHRCLHHSPTAIPQEVARS